MLTAFSWLPEAPQSGDGCGSSLLPILSPILQYLAPTRFPSRSPWIRSALGPAGGCCGFWLLGWSCYVIQVQAEIPAC